MSDFRKRLEERAREEQKNAGRETGPRFSDVLAEYKKGRQAEEAYQTYLKQMQMKPVSDSIYTQYTGQMDNYRKTVEDFNSGINQPYKKRQAELLGAKARTLVGRLMAQNEGLDTSWYEQVARDYTSAYDSLTDLGKEQHARGDPWRPGGDI